MKKRLLSMLTCLALCLGLLPVTALAADVIYAERSWDSGTNTVKSAPQTCSDATVVTENDDE